MPHERKLGQDRFMDNLIHDSRLTSRPESLRVFLNCNITLVARNNNIADQTQRGGTTARFMKEQRSISHIPARDEHHNKKHDSRPSIARQNQIVVYAGSVRKKRYNKVQKTSWHT